MRLRSTDLLLRAARSNEEGWGVRMVTTTQPRPLLQGFTLSRIAALTGGQLIGQDKPVTGFATDSGSSTPGDFFLAIKGARVDGHNFVSDAIAKGVAGTLAEREVPGSYVLVPNLVEALANMASQLRETFKGPVVGVTGSAGKTTTKEFIAAALSPLGPVLKTEGNRNTEFTAPLLWAELTPEHRAVVVEMSMRGFRQVEHLANFSRPTVGVVTNIGMAHIELVGSREGIAIAKAELLEALSKDGTAVLWQDCDYLDLLKEKAGSRRVLTFGEGSDADSRITEYQSVSWTECQVSGEIDGHSWSTVLPAEGKIMAINAATAIAVAYALGIDPAEAAEAMRNAKLPALRMQVVDLNGAHIILDTYNASPASMIASLETLTKMRVAGRRRAVIGEMRELGDYASEAHATVGKAIATSHLDEVLFVGEPLREAMNMATLAGTSARMADGMDDVREFLRASKPGDAVLVKGSRALELEKALENLS